MNDPRKTVEPQVIGETWWQAWGPFVFALLVAIATAGICSLLCAQWGTRSGAVAPSVRPIRVAAKVEWVKDRSAPGQIDLVRGGKLLGAYDQETGIYRRLLDYASGTWSEPEALPDDVPLPPGGIIEPITQNFGIDLERLHQAQEGYHYGQQAVSKERAYDIVQNGLPDDQGKLWLTCTGSEKDCERFRTEWNAKAGELANGVLFSVVPKDHFWLKDLNTKETVFRNDGSPTIYLQAPDGRVLWRQDDDKDAVENLRTAKKKYDAAKDPGPNSVTPAMPGLPNIPAPLIVFGGLLLLAFWKGRHATS